MQNCNLKVILVRFMQHIVFCKNIILQTRLILKIYIWINFLSYHAKIISELQKMHLGCPSHNR